MAEHQFEQLLQQKQPQIIHVVHGHELSSVVKVATLPLATTLPSLSRRRTLSAEGGCTFEDDNLHCKVEGETLLTDMLLATDGTDAVLVDSWLDIGKVEQIGPADFGRDSLSNAVEIGTFEVDLLLLEDELVATVKGISISPVVETDTFCYLSKSAAVVVLYVPILLNLLWTYHRENES